MYPNTNLQPGQTGPEVKKLQDFLVSKGLMNPADLANGGAGIYGPKTTAAVSKFQQQNGVDNTSGPGYWGPKTIAAASGAGASNNNPTNNNDVIPPTGDLTPAQVSALQRKLGVPVTGIYDSATRDAEHSANTRTGVSSYASDPDMASILEQNGGIDSFLEAIKTGDYSRIRGVSGQPIDSKAFEAEYQNQMDTLNPAFEEEKAKDKADTESALAAKQAAYQDYLLTSGQNFETDKGTLDQSAANQGVLFSGGRKQKEANLQRGYEQEGATKLRNLTSDIGDTSRNYQYTYGNDAAKGLSSYFKAGGNVYNPNVATGGVTSGGLSSIYNPKSYDYQGTKPRTIEGQAAQRAYGIARNTGYKTTPYSYGR